MKHCQITGVEMPDEKKARDELAELELGDHCYPFMRGWDARADWQAKRDAKPMSSPATDHADVSRESGNSDMSDSSAEFPEARKLAFEAWPPNEVCGYVNVRATLRQGFEVGFERGRASANAELLIYHRMASTGVWIPSEEYAQTVAKLTKAQAEIERLKESMSTNKTTQKSISIYKDIPIEWIGRPMHHYIQYLVLEEMKKFEDRIVNLQAEIERLKAGNNVE